MGSGCSSLREAERLDLRASNNPGSLTTHKPSLFHTPVQPFLSTQSFAVPSAPTRLNFLYVDHTYPKSARAIDPSSPRSAGHHHPEQHARVAGRTLSTFVEAAAAFRGALAPSQSQALAAASRHVGTTAPVLPGISVACLADFARTLVLTRPDAATVTTEQVVHQIIQPLTLQFHCSYVDLPSLPADTSIGPPDYFISHAWASPFLPMVATVIRHLGGLQASGSVRVFLDALCINQHGPDAEEQEAAAGTGSLALCGVNEWAHSVQHHAQRSPTAKVPSVELSIRPEEVREESAVSFRQPRAGQKAGQALLESLLPAYAEQPGHGQPSASLSSNRLKSAKPVGENVSSSRSQQPASSAPNSPGAAPGQPSSQQLHHPSSMGLTSRAHSTWGSTQDVGAGQGGCSTATAQRAGDGGVSHLLQCIEATLASTAATLVHVDVSAWSMATTTAAPGTSILAAAAAAVQSNTPQASAPVATSPFSRLWCLFELDCTLRLRGQAALAVMHPGPPCSLELALSPDPCPNTLSATSVSSAGLPAPEEPSGSASGLRGSGSASNSRDAGVGAFKHGGSSCPALSTAGTKSAHPLVGSRGHALAHIPKIDLNSAGCSKQTDRQAILDHLTQQHGSLAACASRLQLALLLDPIDYSLDLDALLTSAGATGGHHHQTSQQYAFGPLMSQLKRQAQQVAGNGGFFKHLLHGFLKPVDPGSAKSMRLSSSVYEQQQSSGAASAEAGGEDGSPVVRATCILGPAGSGKSCVAAALCMQTRSSGIFQMGPMRSSTAAGDNAGGGPQRLVHAFHFARPHDVERQDPLRIIATLACQLSHTVPQLQPYYAALPPDELLALRSGRGSEDPSAVAAFSVADPVEAAYRRLLLLPLLQCRQQVVLLLDGLDQGSGPVAGAGLGKASGGGTTAAAAAATLNNPGMLLLLRHFSSLPPNVYLIVTSRTTSPLADGMRLLFPGLQELTPKNLRRRDAVRNHAQHLLLGTAMTRVTRAAVMGKSSEQTKLLDELTGGGAADLCPLYLAMAALRLQQQLTAAAAAAAGDGGSEPPSPRSPPTTTVSGHAGSALSLPLLTARSQGSLSGHTHGMAGGNGLLMGQWTKEDVTVRGGNLGLAPGNLRPEALISRGLSKLFEVGWPQAASKQQAVRQVLQVLVAAREPLPLLMLHGMGLSDALLLVPGWGVLLRQQGDRVVAACRPLLEWLRDHNAAGEFYVSGQEGHRQLARHLVARPWRTLCECGLRHLPHHLVQAGAAHAELLGQLDCLLSEFEYVQYVCVRGWHGQLCSDLAALRPSARPPAVRGVLRWLQACGGAVCAWPEPCAALQLAVSAPLACTLGQAARALAPGIDSRAGGSHPAPVAGVFAPAPPRTPTRILPAPAQATLPLAPAPTAACGSSSSMAARYSLLNRPNDWSEPRLVLRGHRGAVTCVAVHPGGQVIASGSEDGTIRLWCPYTGSELCHLAAHERAVTCIAFSRGGSRMASAAEGLRAQVALWDCNTWQRVADISGHSDSVLCLAFHQDGSLLATGSRDKSVRLWSPDLFLQVDMVEGAGQAVTCMAFSPGDDGILAFGSSDKKVYLWDPQRQAEVGALPLHSEAVRALAFSPEPPLLASASARQVVLWDWQQLVPLSCLEGPQLQGAEVCCLAFSGSGAELALGASSGLVAVFDVEEGAQIACLEGHTGPVTGLSYTPTPKGQYLLASSARDGTIRVLDQAGVAAVAAKTAAASTHSSCAAGMSMGSVSTVHGATGFSRSGSARSQQLQPQPPPQSASATAPYHRRSRREPSAGNLARVSFGEGLLPEMPGAISTSQHGEERGPRSQQGSSVGHLESAPTSKRVVIHNDSNSQSRSGSSRRHSNDLLGLKEVEEGSVEGREAAAAAADGGGGGRGSRRGSRRGSSVGFGDESLLDSGINMDLARQARTSVTPLGSEMHSFVPSARPARPASRAPPPGSSNTGEALVPPPSTTSTTSTPLLVTPGHVTSSCMAPSGELLASGSYAGKVTLWDMVTGQALQVSVSHAPALPRRQANNSGWGLVGMSNLSRAATGGSSSGSGAAATTVAAATLAKPSLLQAAMQVAATATGQAAQPSDTPPAAAAGASATNHAAQAPPTNDPSDEPQSAKTATELRVEGAITALSFSHDSRYLAAGGEKAVALWSMTSAGSQSIGTSGVSGAGAAAAAAGFQPASAAATKMLQLLAVMKGHSEVRHLAFSPVGGILVSGSAKLTESVLSVWEVPSGHQRGVLLGFHQCAVTSLAFSPANSTWLATGGQDGSVGLWDLSTCRLLLELVEGSSMGGAGQQGGDGSGNQQQRGFHGLWHWYKASATQVGVNKAVTALAFCTHSRLAVAQGQAAAGSAETGTSGSSNLLAVGRADGTIQLVDCGTGLRIGELAIPLGLVASLSVQGHDSSVRHAPGARQQLAAAGFGDSAQLGGSQAMGTAPRSSRTFTLFQRSIKKADIQVGAGGSGSGGTAGAEPNAAAARVDVAPVAIPATVRLGSGLRIQMVYCPQGDVLVAALGPTPSAPCIGSVLCAWHVSERQLVCPPVRDGRLAVGLVGGQGRGSFNGGVASLAVQGVAELDPDLDAEGCGHFVLIRNRPYCLEPSGLTGILREHVERQQRLRRQQQTGAPHPSAPHQASSLAGWLGLGRSSLQARAATPQTPAPGNNASRPGTAATAGGARGPGEGDGSVVAGQQALVLGTSGAVSRELKDTATAASPPPRLPELYTPFPFAQEVYVCGRTVAVVAEGVLSIFVSEA